MIAIAGAKGGCGKTVTALALAEAFVRNGQPAVAIDADRQLPNLHTIGNVDRSPTLADCDETTEITEITHQSPRDAGIVTAPHSSDRIEMETVFKQIDESERQVIVDCPSGAGPDVVDPLSVADRVVVVTTGTKRSLAAAKKTVKLANRLDIPIEGAILNRCDGIPEHAVELDIPVIATVPECPEPLSAEQTTEAYDLAVDRLTQDHVPLNTSDHLSTGIASLDDELGGGPPPGSIVALQADPDSQSELLLYEMLSERGTLYITTERSEQTVRQDIDRSLADCRSPTIRHIDETEPLSQTSALIEKVPDSANIIIDTMSVLERTDRSEYTAFLNHLVERVRETDSMAILHCLRGTGTPKNRSSTEHFADTVLTLQTTTHNDSVDRSLSITKSRTSQLPAEPIDIDLSADPVLGIKQQR